MRGRATVQGPVSAGSADQTRGLVAPEVWDLARYFLWLGATGFGGPVALVSYMQRDLVVRRRWFDDETYNLALAFSQLLPGPLAVQLAVTLGFFRAGFVGATLCLVAFVTPPLLLVLVLSILYVSFGGLWWMPAVFYGIGAASLGIVAVAAVRLARRTVGRERLLWGIFVALAMTTTVTQVELAGCIALSGLLVLLVKSPPGWLVSRLPLAALGPGSTLPLLQTAPAATDVGLPLLLQILLFFGKAGSFAFGSGFATIPVLERGVVHEFGWLTEQQFLDAIPMMVVTPGPALAGVAFIGYLVAGLPGAVAAAIGIFTPVYLFVLGLAPWFHRHRHHPQLAAFVQGATAAATGAIAGSVIVLGRRAIVDVPTTLIGLVSLILLWRLRLPEPLVVIIAGLVGLVIWPSLRATSVQP